LEVKRGEFVTWGKFYWPTALISVLVVLLAPEGIALATGYQNTLSYWVWTQLHATMREPMSQWTATHFLTFGGWLVLVVWLTWHLFLHWWA
jgi:hypothetical protein